MTVPPPTPFAVLPRGAAIGILGGGQLGRMLAMSAAKLGFKVHIFSDAEDSPAFDVARTRVLGSYTDLAAIEAFARGVDVITYEFENVPLEAVAAAARICPVRPGAKALAASQDRLVEKSFLRDLGIPVAPFTQIDDEASLRAAMAQVGGAAILKTRRLGYDGKGQVRLGQDSDPRAALTQIGRAPAILEWFVPFDFEISIIAVRGGDGAMAFYDPPRNQHENGILARSTVPAGVSRDVVAEAQTFARRIADGLDYAGVLAVEFFYAESGSNSGGPGRLVVNEFAPRVHNSGHWTLEACAISQFENHIRAVAGWPLGSTMRHSDAVMSNLIGARIDNWRDLAGEAGLCVHLYGKGEASDGRKMGHTTLILPLTPSKPGQIPTNRTP